ncbi:MAG: glycosyltransferase family 39 protein [Myxococcota bacterium]|nr:glycosyltransferase family 39 protein [Myxococcota bacterium]
MPSARPSPGRLVWLAISTAMLLSLVMVPIPWGDSSGSVFGAISLLCEGDLDFDEFPFLYEREPRGSLTPDPLRTVHPDPEGSRLLSFTGLGVKLLHLPVALVGLHPWFSTTSELEALRANQVTGLLSCLAILLLMGRVFRDELGPRLGALALAALFFGTTFWPQCRQTLWSNQAATLGVAFLVFGAFRARRQGLSSHLALSLGLAAGWAIMTRGGTAVLCLPLLVAILMENKEQLRRSLGWIVLGGIPFALLFAWDNLVHTGSLWTPTFLPIAAEISQRMGEEDSAFGGHVLRGLAGSLFSPSRGLLVFSPFLVLALPGAWRAWRSRDRIRISMALGVAGLLLINASYTDWWGAACWGPRRLMEALPLLTLLVFEPTWARQRPGRGVAALGGLLLILALGIQSIGFFFYDSSWDAHYGPTQNLRLEEGDLVYPPRAEAEAVFWSVEQGVLADSLGLAKGRSEAGTARLQFGLDSRFTFSAGDYLPAPIPPCSRLREVDRYPPPPGGDDPR